MSPTRGEHESTDRDSTGWSRLADEQGAGLAEYGMLGFFILVVCVTAMTLLGETLSSLYDTIRTTLF